jgi:hypothetical protein
VKRFLMTTIALAALVGPAMAGIPVQAANVTPDTPGPALFLNALTMHHGYKTTNEQCVNQGLSALGKINAQDVSVSSNTVWGEVSVNGHHYSVGAYCVMDDEHGVVVISAAGPEGKDTGEILERLANVWTGK